jgi:hypothetical protein
LCGDLQQQVSASLGPVHLLVLDHSPADKLVYGRLGKSGTDSFFVAMAVAVIRSVGLIVSNVVAEFANRAQPAKSFKKRFRATPRFLSDSAQEYRRSA